MESDGSGYVGQTALKVREVVNPAGWVEPPDATGTARIKKALARKRAPANSTL
jgi:hypothetical protein